MVGPYTPMMPTTVPFSGMYAPNIGLRQGMRSAGPWMRPSRPWMGPSGPRMGPWNGPCGSSLGYPGQPMVYPGPGISIGHPGPHMGHTRQSTGFLGMSGSGMRSRGMSPPPSLVKKKKVPEVTEEKKPELKGEQKPESKGEQKPESEGEQKPESEGEQKPESKGEQKPESEGEQKLVIKPRPVAITPIPGTVWCVVQTNDGKHFFYDPSKRRSVWRMPEELKNNPDVDKLLPPKPEVKAVKREEKDVQEEPPAKKFKSEVEVKESKEECAKEGAQEAVLKKETTNTVQVQAAAVPLEVLEVRVKQFKELLAEKNVCVPSKWEWEFAKVEYDKRYSLLTSQERRQAYYEFVEERAEELRIDNIRRASEAKQMYRQLLEESNLNIKSTFRDFTINHSSDSRFRMITSMRDRHSMFLDYMAEKEKLKNEFMNLLSETPGINRGSKWKFVRGTLSSDPRFKAEAETRRASWFQLYLKSENFEKKNFLIMLSEVPGINESTSWSDVKNKVSSDRRYKAVVSDSDRENWFGKHLKIVKDKKNDYLKMLSEIPGINDNTSWSDVRNKVSSDPRYKAVVRYSDRQDLIRTYLKTLNDTKNDFLKMLSEIPGINDNTSWSDVKNKVSSDPRYKAVASDSAREDWFATHLTTIKNKKDDFLKMLSELPGINDNTSWSDVKNKVSSEPCYKAVASDSDREDWFRIHLKTIKDTKTDFLKMLSEIPGINDSTSWSDVRNKVSSDPRYKAVVRYSDREDWIRTYLKTIKDKKNDFLKMLSEIPGINDSTSWSDVKNKVSSDPRYKAVASGSDREDWFRTYLKTIKDKKDDFLKMLSEIPGINDNTSWIHVRNKVSLYPRYKAVANDSDREDLFRTHLKTMKDKKTDFLKMLSEIPGIDDSTSWIDVRNKVSSDSRYMVVVRYSDREDWIKTYLKTIKDKKFDFLKMLSEIPGMNDNTSWSDVKDKVSLDPRYKAVAFDSDREDWFRTYLKTIKDKKDDFLKMLSEIPGINENTSWSDVKNKVSLYPRYKAVASDSDREDLFRTHLKTMKDKKTDFLKMLSEIPGINESTSWIDVRNKVSSDPRYMVVVRYPDREDWIRTYLKTIKDATSDDIRNKAEQSRNVPSSSVMEKDESKKSHREVATEDFKHFLIEKVKHSEGSFESFKSRFDRNPRWTEELTESEKKTLYDSHVGERNKQILHTSEVKENFKKMLSVIPGINRSSSWREVKSKVSSDPRYKAVASDSRREDWFRAFVKTLKDVPYDDIRNKKQQINSFQSSSLKEKDDSSMSHREAAEKDFIKFLAEKVTNCESSFESFKSRFDADPRWAEELTDADKKKLYDSHVEEIQKQNLEILWSVLDEIENERSAGAGKNLCEKS